MNTKEKRVLGFLVIMFAFTLIILLSQAVDAEGVTNVSTAEEFKTAVENSATEINVMNDINLTNLGVLNISKSTINLNNHTIKANNFTLIFEGSDFTIKNGTFDANGGSYGLFIGDEGITNNITIENINIIGGINVYNSTNVVLKNVSANGCGYYAIWCDENAHVTVKSGKFTSSGVAVIGMSETETSLDIEGGTFITQGRPLVLPSNQNKKYNIPTIKGGTFDVLVANEYCAESYEPVTLGENNYSVCNHSDTIEKEVVKSTCTSDGYSGNIYCSKCNKLIKSGEVIPASGHTPSEWKFNKDNHWKECEKENCKIIIPDSLEAHKFNDNGKCEVCSYRNENAIVTLENKQTNIKIDFKNSVLEDDVNLEVIPISTGTIYENIKKTLSNENNFIAFDINLLHNGVKVQPNGNLLLSIPVPEKFDKTRLAIYRIDGENKTEYNGKLIVIDNKNYIQFETNHFSYYVLAEKSVSNFTPENPQTDTTSVVTLNETKKLEHKLDNEPKTGEFDKILFAEVVFAISLVAYIILKKWCD